MQALSVAIAIIAGIIVGFLIRSASVRRESALLEQRNREGIDALNALQRQLAHTQSESAARAGFEPLANERAANIVQLNTEIAALRFDLASKAASESALSARISELEAELKNERRNLGEKIELLETAKKALADQFQTLATDILETKSKTFAEGSQKELGNLLAPLRTQIEDFRKKVEEAQSDSKTGVTKLE